MGNSIYCWKREKQKSELKFEKTLELKSKSLSHWIVFNFVQINLQESVRETWKLSSADNWITSVKENCTTGMKRTSLSSSGAIATYFHESRGQLCLNDFLLMLGTFMSLILNVTEWIKVWYSFNVTFIYVFYFTFKEILFQRETNFLFKNLS